MRQAVLAAPLSALLILAPAAAGAVDSEKAAYVSGPFDEIPVGAEGTLSTADAAKLLFVADKGAGVIEIPWNRVLDVEYGQKVTSFIGKRREHFVSFAYRDPRGAERILMLELGKSIILASLDAFERLTGRRVVYRDAEAAQFRIDESGEFRIGR